MSKLIMMIGILGSGKLTWIKNNRQKIDALAIVSRDAIRFAMLKEDEDYFAHEAEVFNKFIAQIIAHLLNGKTVVADATHLSKKSRALVLNKVREYADEIEAVVLDTDLETAFERNDQREGRAWVKHGIIRRMWFSMEMPEEAEGFNKITIIKEEK